MSRVDANRKIAEWLGWKYQCTCSAHVTEHRCTCGARPLPDFYADEAANALVLEKMPSAALMFYPGLKVWSCRYDALGVGYLSDVEHDDRKTAICEAALLLMRAGDEHE